MKDKELEKTEEYRQELRLTPAVDVYERKDEVVLIADLPGVSEKGLEITLDSDKLTINGHTDKDAYAAYTYERSFTLSDKVAKDKIAAKVKDGVLTLNIPYAEEAKARKIPITWN